MLLLRIAGHSGAGKSRLVTALGSRGLASPRVVVYTSRLPREGESHGRDYYFLSRGAISALPREHFVVGPCREMLQAVDLEQLAADLQKSPLVVIDLYQTLWPAVAEAMRARLGEQLRTLSVFMTAVDPGALAVFDDDAERARAIEREVERILHWRGKDPAAAIAVRARSAVAEVLAGLQPGAHDRVFHSSPEGPDGQDDWTRSAEPVGHAARVLEGFVELAGSAS